MFNLRRLGVASVLSVVALAGSVMNVTPALAQAGEPHVGPPIVETRPGEASEQAPVSPPLNLRRPEQPLELRQESGGLGWGAKLGLVGLAFAGAYFMYRRKTGSSIGQTMGPIARVVGRTPIGPRSSVVIVEVDGQRILLGVTPTTITTLTVLVDEPKMKGHEIDDDYEPSSTLQTQPIAPAPAPEPPSSRWSSTNDRVDVEASLNRLIAQARGEIDELSSRHASGPAPRATRDRDREQTRETPREALRDLGRETPQDAGRETRGELAREIPREPTPITSRRARPREVSPLEGQGRGLGRRGV